MSGFRKAKAEQAALAIHPDGLPYEKPQARLLCLKLEIDDPQEFLGEARPHFIHNQNERDDYATHQ